jgi:predicted DNA-binding transcriptional regulator YafY
MPASDHGASLERHWEILKNQLPSRPPGRTASEIRDSLARSGHDVSKRTVERDLLTLETLFPIQRNEAGTPYGWYWMPSARLDIFGIDLVEAVSLGLMEDLLRQMMPTTMSGPLSRKFAMAREKLAALQNNPNARWKDLVCYLPPGLPFLPPDIDGDVVQTVQEALMQQRQLRVSYRSFNESASKEMLLHPLSLIQQGPRLYLIATAYDYQDPRPYLLHRIESASMLDESCRRPKNFSLENYLASGSAQFGSGELIVLKARVSPELRTLLLETPLAADQKITTRAGVHTLTATVRTSWNLDFWILSQGASITILQPTSLRKHIIANLRHALAQYE